MNRVTTAIERQSQNIADRLKNGVVTQAQIDNLHKVLDLDFYEYCKFQELKSAGMMESKLTLEEAQTIYGYLGNVPDTFNNQPIAVKTVLTQIYKELLGFKITELKSR